MFAAGPTQSSPLALETSTLPGKAELDPEQTTTRSHEARPPKSISPVGVRFAQSALNLNAHVIRSVVLRGRKSHTDNPIGFELYPL
jgi:hypothetical protein